LRRISEADDYTVKISGNLVSYKGTFPSAQLLLLNQILNSEKSITVASAYLALFNIFKLTLKTANFMQSAMTYLNSIPYELNFVSDKDYSFLIKE
jgi:hypothetical protein